MSTVSQTTKSPRLKRVLGLPATVLFGLAYMLPLTVFTTYGIVNELTEGHIVSSYLVTLVAMLFTAASYARMVKAFPMAGSAYTYTRKTLGGNVGFLGGWALLLDYLLMPMITYLVIGIYMQASFPTVSQPVWIILSLVIVTALNVAGIKMVSKASSLLLVFQTVFLLVFGVMGIRAATNNPMPSIVDMMIGMGPGTTAIFAGSAILCLSFLGFDAVSSLAEETVDPKKVIPKAIILVTLLGGVLFVVISVIANLAFPDWSAYTSVDSAALDVTHAAGGAFLEAFFTAAYIAGCFGAVLASQTTVSRILYSMGRDGVLPRRVFGQLHPRFQTPVYSTLVVGAIGLFALVIDLTLASSLISFGALSAFTLVNIAVIKHYYLDQKCRSGLDTARYLAAPAIGVFLCLWLWTSLSMSAFVVGFIWLAIGMVYLAVLTRGFRKVPPELPVADD
ncbi:APC family permease [Paeniglutamicibacter sp. ABSL32-1]|uniref:APC family permease n=1 Tax=Paeniglutamicibacter quisquiliarum TaxID=2849498 RepID=UPI001C2D46FA|nr:APC family permease [Paeniglutamicibacter quisquiliarum]MBV1780078.1 APC family permease [Paeniglutamicibacter quisquiliarum]